MYTFKFPIKISAVTFWPILNFETKQKVCETRFDSVVTVNN